jgi:chemotaxis response regulator CheB
VTKHITGPAGRHHGRIAILVACGGPVFDFTFVIPAHAGPGSVTRHFDNIPSGSRCHVTETENGHTNTVAVVASGSRTVTIPANGRATVHITDRFTVKPVTPPPPLVTG